MTRKAFAAMVTLCLLCLGTMAQSVTFCYADGTEDSWGTGKKNEHYDVAVRIDNPHFTGNRLTCISIPVKDDPNIGNYRVWLARELTLESIDGVKQCRGDVSFSVSPVGGRLSVTLSEPLTIGEDGIFVGYSFDVGAELTDVSKRPVAGEAAYHSDNGLWVHTTRTHLNWMQLSLPMIFTSAITVGMESDVAHNAVGFVSLPYGYATASAENLMRAEIANFGDNAVSSIDIRCTADGKERTEHIVLDEPIAPGYELTRVIGIPLPLLERKGEYDVTAEITAVNGETNSSDRQKAESTLRMLTLVPRHRAVLEEYTGLWCGYCPRGFAAIEYMNRLYPDDFIALSYHNRDDMEVMAADDFPSSIGGFPAAVMDRVFSTDAYSGAGEQGVFGFDRVWADRCAVLAPAAIDAKATWTDGGRTAIDVETTVTLAMKTDGRGYMPAYVLTADGLYSDNWYQANYYSGTSEENHWLIPEMRQFTEGDKYVTGLSFDDVVVLAPHVKGIEDALPDMEEDETAVHRYRMDLAEAVNTKGEPVIQDKSRLHVVAMLIDRTTGEIVNAVKTSIGNDPAGMAGAKAEAADNVKMEYFDMAGRKITTAGRGIYIKVSTDGKGNRKAEKEIIK